MYLLKRKSPVEYRNSVHINGIVQVIYQGSGKPVDHSEHITETTFCPDCQPSSETPEDQTQGETTRNDQRLGLE